MQGIWDVSGENNMKLVFITPTFNLGGYEKVVLGYANAFVKMGHCVTIICGFKEGVLLEQTHPDVNIVEFGARVRNFTRPLAKFLKENEVDILYAGFRTYTCVAVLAKWVSGNNKCVIYGSAHGYGRDSRLTEFLSGRIMRHTDVLTAVTQELAEFESKALNIPISKYRVFHNPVIDDSLPVQVEFHPWLGKDKRVPVIIVSGRLESDKGKRRALEIFCELQKRIDTRLLVLGSGSMLDELKEYALNLGIADKVDFLGFVANPMGYMIQSDVFLHPADLEAFGNVIVEALYCNLPVVTTKCKGPEEIIEHGKYGIVIGESTDPDVVRRGADALYDILTGKIKFSGLRERALEFDAKYLEPSYLEPYYELRGKD